MVKSGKNALCYISSTAHKHQGALYAGRVHVGTLKECQDKCLSNLKCNFFSYWEDGGYCQTNEVCNHWGSDYWDVISTYKFERNDGKEPRPHILRSILVEPPVLGACEHPPMYGPNSQGSGTGSRHHSNRARGTDSRIQSNQASHDSSHPECTDSSRYKRTVILVYCETALTLHCVSVRIRRVQVGQIRHIQRAVLRRERQAARRVSVDPEVGI